MALFEKLKMTCREATMLSAGVTRRSLPAFTRIRYRLHLIICAACRRFVKQADAICHAAGKGDVGNSENCPDHIKKKIISRLRQDE